MRPTPLRLALGILSLGFVLAVSPQPPRLSPRPKPGRAPQVPGRSPRRRPTPGPQWHLAEREYRASESGAGLQAPNRAHNLRTWFEKAGIRVHDRTAAGSPELLRLTLARAGRGDALAALAPGEAVEAAASRVEIRRPRLVEWYVNSAAGLEQGFTLAERPAGEGPLVLELAVAGATARLRGEAVVFATGAKRRLRYGALAAADAGGRALAARFEVPAPERLRIVVEDAEATYPLVIDPLLTEAADTQLESNQASAQLGVSVAGAGDVNGDGYADVIVGADRYDAGESDEGAVFVFLGSASGIADGNPSTAATQLESDQASAYLGYSVAGAGDVNGDGYADVIVGAWEYFTTDAGSAFVFHGSASGIADGTPATAVAHLTRGGAAGAYFGRSVAGAGDVNADGFADVIVGAPFHGVVNGAAFVYHGSASGFPNGNPFGPHYGAATFLSDPQDLAGFGVSVAGAGAGDVNGDGYADVIVGSITATVSVFLGSATGVADGNPSTAAALLELGPNVAGDGDVNGDGTADVIVGDFYAQAGEGAAFVFLGNGDGDGRPVLARQLRSSVDTPIQPWGRAHSKHVFRVRMQATHPEGRGRVKLRIEYCPPGVAFGHASCGSKTGASWTDVTATSGGVTLTETVDSLVNNTNYRWRARVQYAPFRVIEAGITAPPKPAHGPWRRVGAQAVEADLRTRKSGGSCGFGFEVALLLPVWLALRRNGPRTGG